MGCVYKLSLELLNCVHFRWCENVLPEKGNPTWQGWRILIHSFSQHEIHYRINFNLLLGLGHEYCAFFAGYRISVRHQTAGFSNLRNTIMRIPICRSNINIYSSHSHCFLLCKRDPENRRSALGYTWERALSGDLIERVADWISRYCVTIPGLWAFFFFNFPAPRKSALRVDRKLYGFPMKCN